MQGSELKGRAGSSVWGLSTKKSRDKTNRMCCSQETWSYKNECQMGYSKSCINTMLHWQNWRNEGFWMYFTWKLFASACFVFGIRSHAHLFLFACSTNYLWIPFSQLAQPGSCLLSVWSFWILQAWMTSSMAIIGAVWPGLRLSFYVYPW